MERKRTENDESDVHNGTNYFQVPLDARNRFRLFWSIDYEAEVLTMEFRILLSGRYDWFAFGFSDYGEINNADLCIFWLDKKDRLHFKVSEKIEADSGMS